MNIQNNDYRCIFEINPKNLRVLYYRQESSKVNFEYKLQLGIITLND